MFQPFFDKHQVPDSYQKAIDNFLIPLADEIIENFQFSKKLPFTQPFVLGVSGSQGSGKSTLAECLKILFEKKTFSTQILSIDDFYYTKAERTKLKSIHPLLQTRGVPGTHDLDKLFTTLNLLRENQPAKLPRFDKLTDDRITEISISPCQIILLEGWCVGWGWNYHLTHPQIPDIDIPLNSLEQDEDPQGVWRSYVDSQRENYYPINDLIDYLVYLKIPNFEMAYQWRWEQEQKLSSNKNSSQQKSMTADEIKRFVQHYERITRELILNLPALASSVISINQEHDFYDLVHP